MSNALSRTFDTPEPVQLVVEVGAGSVTVVATETTETTVEVSGSDADQTEVTQSGREISVIAPRRRTGFLSFGSQLDVSVRLPIDSEVSTRVGSADVTAEGRLGTSRIRAGSGDIVVAHVDGHLMIEVGSGEVTLGTVSGELRVKSGSGYVQATRVGGNAAISTGSGDVSLANPEDKVVVKTGSGDLDIHEVGDDVSLSTASGDLRIARMTRGRVSAKAASGDVRIGIPHGTPVWTDISTISGTVRTDLESAGEPAEGQDHIEVRAKTVSGTVHLQQL